MKNKPAKNEKLPMSDDSPEVLALFRGVHASNKFSFDSAYKAFARIKSKNRKTAEEKLCAKLDSGTFDKKILSTIANCKAAPDEKFDEVKPFSLSKLF